MSNWKQEQVFLSSCVCLVSSSSTNTKPQCRTVISYPLKTHFYGMTYIEKFIQSTLAWTTTTAQLGSKWPGASCGNQKTIFTHHIWAFKVFLFVKEERAKVAGIPRRACACLLLPALLDASEVNHSCCLTVERKMSDQSSCCQSFQKNK